MANTFYPSAMSRFAKGEIDWESDDIRIRAVSSTYTYDSAHEFADDLSGQLGTETALSGCTVLDDGVLDATSPLSYPGVTAGQTVAGYAIYKWVTSAADSPLILFLDTNDDGTPISRAGDGTNIAVVWSSTADRIARI